MTADRPPIDPAMIKIDADPAVKQFGGASDDAGVGRLRLGERVSAVKGALDDITSRFRPKVGYLWVFNR